MISLLQSDLSTALAWTIIHSLWQIIIVAVVLVLVLRMMRQRSAQLRYVVALGALAQSLLLALITFCIYFFDGTSGQEVMISPAAMLTDIGQPTATGKLVVIKEWLTYYSPFIVSIWGIGSVLFVLKFLVGYTYVSHIANVAQNEAKSVIHKVNKLRKKFDIARKVQVKCSNAIQTPMILGIVKPLILFPIGMINHLSSEELEAVLSHELAHIRRHDFLVNIVQSIIESFFYYHPGIWFISRIIHEEREACCDELAVEITGNKISYAQTLIRLQELRQTAISPALGLTGKNQPFTNRIKRILDVPIQLPRIRERVISLMVLCLVMVSVLGNSSETSPFDLDNLDVYVIDDCPVNPTEIKYYLDTIPDRNSFHIKKRSLDREVELHMEEGLVKSLKVNGEEYNQVDFTSLQSILDELQPNKKENLITIFPDCGEGFGKVYYVDEHRQAINLDNYFEVEKMSSGSYDLHLQLEASQGNQFDERYIDSIQESIRQLDWSQISPSPKIQIDSIFDLLPQIIRPSEATTNVYEAPVNKQLMLSMRQDHLIGFEKEQTIELTGEYMSINGVLQPLEVWQKYKSLYESTTGITLTPNSRLEL